MSQHQNHWAFVQLTFGLKKDSYVKCIEQCKMYRTDASDAGPLKLIEMFLFLALFNVSWTKHASNPGCEFTSVFQCLKVCGSPIAVKTCKWETLMLKFEKNYKCHTGSRWRELKGALMSLDKPRILKKSYVFPSAVCIQTLYLRYNFSRFILSHPPLLSM